MPKIIDSIPVIVLCGGLGTRMITVTNDVLPKHLLVVDGETILDKALYPFTSCQRLIMAVGYHHQQITKYMKSRWPSKEVQFSLEPKPLGVVGATKLALSLVDGEQFFLCHGDEVIEDLDIEDMLLFHQSHHGKMTVLTTTCQPAIKDFDFECDVDGRALKLFRIDQIPSDKLTGNYGVGVFVGQSDIAEKLIDDYSWTDFLRSLIATGELYAYRTAHTFYNLNQPADIKQLRQNKL